MKKYRILTFILLAAGMVYSCKKDGSSGTAKPLVTAVGVNDGTAVTEIIGTSGGIITSADGEMVLEIPSGALTTNTDITIQPITNNVPSGRRKAYRCTPDGLKFGKNIIIRFNYTAQDLAATEPEYMMMAFQTAEGNWQLIEGISNDQGNQTISASIDHFTDFAAFDVMRIIPPDLYLRAGQTGQFEISATGTAEVNGVHLLSQLLETNAAWKVNGITGGNASVGTIASGSEFRGNYVAPATAPSTNPVTVTAELNFPFNVDGQQFNHGILTARAHIIGGRYKVDIESSNDIAVGTGEVFRMTDHLRFTVNIIGAEGTVTDIQNSFPTFHKIAQSTNGCTTTFEREGTGPMNPHDVHVAGVTYSSLTGDVYVHFNAPIPMVTPRIIKRCPGSPDQSSDLVIWDFSGAVVAFKDNGQVQTIHQGANGQIVDFTFTPLQ